MPANPITFLKSRAECDAVLATLALKLRTYQHRDYNATFADETDELRTASTATRLAKAAAAVERYTQDLADPDLTKTEWTRIKQALITATAQRDRLELAVTDDTGADAYLADVDDDLLDGQVAILLAAQKAVTDHRATLAA
ncbi:hypothetical protein [Hymenobacter chitinivorans]|uniref:Uncharacterized protein n=1 Tax=Hymenobacter chitinivorans DSM 11115 TaxID=1121954 RepID=A0A2M9B511_9BACT|nr:hypothetical protein [Hymenobacter chitinivorans]PJJ53029.1 hypothetical protein CLV45_3687 [Hymenobacter chitinivorans DSM 11115]